MTTKRDNWTAALEYAASNCRHEVAHRAQRILDRIGDLSTDELGVAVRALLDEFKARNEAQAREVETLRREAEAERAQFETFLAAIPPEELAAHPDRTLAEWFDWLRATGRLVDGGHSQSGSVAHAQPALRQ